MNATNDAAEDHPAIRVMREEIEVLRSGAASDEIESRRAMGRALSFWQTAERRRATADQIERDLRTLIDALYPPVTVDPMRAACNLVRDAAEVSELRDKARP